MASTHLIRCIQRPRATGSVSARLVVGLLLASGVAACGFHLRGEANYAFKTVYVNYPSTAPITTDLRRSLEAAGSAKVVAAADKAQVVLDVNSVEDNKHILSLSSGGKVFEYLLTKRVLFRVHDAEGNDWLPTTEVLIRRTYTYSDTEALAKTYEEERLWRDMQADAVQQIVRRLQVAKKPVA
jgi:LPS-assembly lipoprotein